MFHRAKDKEERFSAFSSRVELFEKSKLIRNQVRHRQADEWREGEKERERERVSERKKERERIR